MKKNHGKQFEKDFQASALEVMSYDRLNDPGSSFNKQCQGCDKIVTRFAPRHLCDAIGYYYPYMFYFELKSVKGKSVPFKNIMKSEKDTRLIKLADKNNICGVYPYVIFNFRTEDNQTYAVNAKIVLNFIRSEQRKSIPIEICINYGVKIESKLKKVHYSYDILSFLKTF